MRVRPLTLSELPLLERLGQAFFEEKRVPGVYSQQAMVRYWTAVEASQAGRIFAVFDGTQLAGCLGCIVSPDFATDALAADEIFFYIDRPYRGSRAAYLLLSEYLMYAQDRGARVARLSHFIDDAATVGRIYCRYGFGPINTVYVKELSWDGQLQP